MKPTDFFMASRDMVDFITTAPCCDKPGPGYQLTDCGEDAVVECGNCLASWAVRTNRYPFNIELFEDIIGACI